MDNQSPIPPQSQPPMDSNIKDSIVARLKEATNVLVTVSNDPSVDQLAACIGFTLLLNKIGKRGAAVFSGAVPSTLEFLQPDKTIEKNTDSLRDFIIALDKAKADKLRYKVEDKVVKIFITPYRTSISDKDLDFSQGDFNVDVVLALGVHQRSELDQAIVSHGRILHDATVISVNNRDQGNLGTLNWVDLQASSLSEMMSSIGEQLGGAEAFDNQIATALMTGIVAETDRFSNDKTSPTTMKLASDLMGAGANQQLIAAKLEEPGATLNRRKETGDKESDDGELTIEHDPDAEADKSKTDEVSESDDEAELELPEPKQAIELDASPPESEAANEPVEPPQPPISKISGVRSSGTSADTEKTTDDSAAKDDETSTGGRATVTEPPKMGGKLTANSEPEHLSLDPSTDPLSSSKTDTKDSLLSRSAKTPPVSPLSPVPSPASAPPEKAPITEEKSEEKLEDARDAVEDAIEEGGDPEKNLEPIKALGAQPVNLDLGHDKPAPAPSPANPTPPAPASAAEPANVPFAPGPTIPPVPPTGNVSMPPNPTTTPPDLSGVPDPNWSPAPAPGPLPTIPATPPSPLPAPGNPLNPASPPTPSPVQSPTPRPATPAPAPGGLVPTGGPQDHSGASGPATPPPPVPPPMMPPSIPSPATPPASNQPPLPPQPPAPSQ